MKRTFAMVLGMIFAVSALASCDQFKNLGGNKAEEEKKKMEEMANQVVQKLAEGQKKAEEEKIKMQQQIDSEVQKRMAEKEAEMKKAAESQPLTQSAQPQPVKIVERVIVKEKAPEEKTGNVEKKLSGYIRVYTDSQLSGKNMSLSFGRSMNTSDGTAFKDNITSFSYEIPPGWQVSLYEASGYMGNRYVVKGTGSLGHLPGYMNDKCSSIRWEKE